MLQKTLSICGTQFKNEGELERVLIRNHHEAIISAENFSMVQRIKNETQSLIWSLNSAFR